MLTLLLSLSISFGAPNDGCIIISKADVPFYALCADYAIINLEEKDA